jgi:hypothetical protein
VLLKDKTCALYGLANDSGADALAVELDYKAEDAELYRETRHQDAGLEPVSGRLERAAGA